MYCKFVWYYVFLLTLLDISLNTKLTAQGNSHGSTVHDSLVEGVTFQEWGKEAGEEGAGGEGLAAVRLTPAVVAFGVRELAAAHAVLVTVTNVANTTLHLASVAGTTPDFHASFFESKTLVAGGNTTFAVVYLGRREGRVAAHIYIHTSLGVHKLPVSAEGVPSAWDAWPLVGVRVPDNATLEPLLTVRNPTATTVQVSEVYSSGAWLGLALPEGGGDAPAALWSIPPRATRPIVRLRIAQPTAAPTQHHHQNEPLTAYIRIKLNITGSVEGDEVAAWTGGLMVAVEARAAPAGEHVRPHHVRLRARGSLDPPGTFDIEMGNSADADVRVEGAVWAASCRPAPHASPDVWDEPALAATNGGGNGAGGAGGGGASIAVLRPLLEPHQPPRRTATLTLDYSKLWAAYSGAAASPAAHSAWCSGWVRLGRAALPYSLHLLPGTVRLDPPHLDFVSGAREQAAQEREVRAHNQFASPLLLTGLECGPHVHEHFHVSGLVTHALGAGARAVVVRVRARAASLARDPPLSLATNLTLHTNVSSYTLPLRLYSGRLQLEWEWPDSADGTLRVGVVGTSQTRRVGARLRNPAPVPVCARALHAALPGAHLALRACAPHAPDDHPCRCVAAGGWTEATLTLVAPAREGALAGAVTVEAGGAGGAARHAVSLRAVAGRVSARPLRLPDAAPGAPACADLLLDSTMQLPMRVLRVTQPPPPHEHDPAVTFVAAESAPAEGAAGGVAGAVCYEPERACAPRCYTGLDLASPEGMAWMARGRDGACDEEALRADAALARERAALFAAQAGAGAGERNVSLLVHTEHVVQLPVGGAVLLRWPRVAAAAGAGDGAPGWAGLAGVGGTAALRVAARNPSRTRPLVLHAALGPATSLPHLANVDSQYCHTENCVYSADAFTLDDWRVTRGGVRLWSPVPVGGADGAGGRALPVLLLEPDAVVELLMTFAPAEPMALTTYLYLRNNLTIVEGVQVAGRGAYPAFELGGRRPGAKQPLLLEVSECGESGAEGAAGEVRHTVVARNTGRVPVRLRDWRVAGAPCAARGLRLATCAPLALAPNESRALTFAFSPDWTLARTTAALTLRTDLGPAEFQLLGAAPALLLPRCAGLAGRPPFEPKLRSVGRWVTLLMLASVVLAGVIDAERLLRRARQARPPAAPPARAPLDLRALAAAPAPAPPAPAPPPPASRPLARRRRTRKVDQQAESRAFELWRASLRRADNDDERSSDDADVETEADDVTPSPPAAPAPPDETCAPLQDVDAFESLDSDVPAARYESRAAGPLPPSSGDDDGSSIGSDSSASSLSSSPPEHDDTDERDNAHESRVRPPAALQRTAPARPGRGSPARDAPPHAHPPADAPPAAGEAGPVRGARARRDREREPSDAPRRAERRAPDGEAPPRVRTAVAKQHARKDKASKRRERDRDRAPPTPPRSSPAAPCEPRPVGASGGAGAAGAAGGVRVGASWSSVVARSGGAASGPAAAPLPPIGSDVRRRAEPARPTVLQDNSLFYFNGEQPTMAAPAPGAVGSRPDEFSWRPTPPPDQPTYVPARDAFGAPPVWGESLAARAPGAAWPWAPYSTAPAGSASPVRPPPGFGASAPGAAALPTASPTRPVRNFDPFHSFASIWSRTALEWRPDDERTDSDPANN